VTFHATPPPESYTLSLHDALPIFEAEERLAESYRAIGIAYLESAEYESAAEAFQNSRNAMEHKNEEFQKDVMMYQAQALQLAGRSEEHTSELQSRFDLVCRLLLEK